MKKTLTAILPDGYKATRTTTRPYTHVVAVLSIRTGETEAVWHDATWTTQPDKAVRAYKGKSWLKVLEVRAIPVEASK